MTVSIRDRLKAASAMWSRYLVLLALSVFFAQLGQGLLSGASTNFFVDTLGLSGKQVLWLAGIREIPGLALMFIAALIMHWPLSRRAAASILLMGLGYGLYATVHSYSALLVVAVVASLGFHNWLPLQSTLGLALTDKQYAGRILGALSSVGSLALIVGMGLTALLATTLPLGQFYVLGGIVIAIGGLLVSRIPKSVGDREEGQPRILVKRRYWLYYVLVFFEGSRRQVFTAFGTLILVQHYGLDARAISLLLVASGIINLIFSPRLGELLDVVGERITLSVSYVALALCFVGYATVHNAWFLGGMLIGINLLVTLRIGLSTYVRRIAPPEELAPTLAVGVSVNHITSVSMSLVAGTLLDLVGYEWLCWGAAAVIMLSVPFALAIKVDTPPLAEPQPGANGKEPDRLHT
jgi:predicted MFS family arabinose efflux permease